MSILGDLIPKRIPLKRSPQPSTKTLPLQATQLECYAACPLDYWTRGIFHKQGCFKPQFGGGGIAISRGILLHRTVERYLDEYKRNSMLDYPRMLRMWTQEAQQNKTYGHDSSFIQSGMDHVKAFHDYFARDMAYDLRPLEMEGKLETRVQCQGLKIKLSGRFDLLNQVGDRIDIIDWKFCAKPPSNSQRAQKRGYFQLAAYAHLLQRQDIHKMICFDITPSGVNKRQWEYSKTTHIDVQNLCQSLISQARQDLRKPQNWEPVKGDACKRCLTKSLKRCPVWKGQLPSETEVNQSVGVQLWEKCLSH